MDIGQKLKNARTVSGITQETAAEKIGVSRQTISNWENNKCYPDIISVIKLSDLYSISLDVLLKEDKKMIEHLDESTNIVSSKRKLSTVIMITAYLIVWALTIVVFWITWSPDPYQMTLPELELNQRLTYIFIIMYLVVMPVTTLIISILLGKDNSQNNFRWLIMLAFFGIMGFLSSLVTFTIYDLINDNGFNFYYSEIVLLTLISSAVGIGIGLIIRTIKSKKIQKQLA